MWTEMEKVTNPQLTKIQCIIAHLNEIINTTISDIGKLDSCLRLSSFTSFCDAIAAQ